MIEGLEQGREIGLEQGREIGLEQGREIGLEQGREIGLEQGREIGLEQGRKIGREIGMLEAKRENARRMKNDGMPVNLIEKYTGLTKEEIDLL